MSHVRGSLLVFVALCAAVGAHGQAVTANLQGVITDASGAVVAGATISAINTETGIQRSAETNADGLYRFNLLPRGQYQVLAKKAGFASQSLNVTLRGGDTATANMVLNVAGQTETVNVSPEASQVDTSSSQIEQPVTKTQIANLPVNDRNFQQLANLIPGAAPSPSYDPTKRLYGGVVSGGAT